MIGARRFLRFVPAALALLSSLVAGTYLGLLSCGSSRIQDELVLVAIIPWAALAIWKPGSSAHPNKARIALVVLLPASLIVSQAIASAFYPASPESINDFLNRLAVHLFSGPC